MGGKVKARDLILQIAACNYLPTYLPMIKTDFFGQFST